MAVRRAAPEMGSYARAGNVLACNLHRGADADRLHSSARLASHLAVFADALAAAGPFCQLAGHLQYRPALVRVGAAIRSLRAAGSADRLYSRPGRADAL